MNYYVTGIADLDIDAMAPTGLVRSIELESDQRFSVLMEELERKETGGEGVGGEGGADGELGGQLGKSVVRQGGKISYRVLRRSNQGSKTGVDCHHAKYWWEEVNENQQSMIKQIHILSQGTPRSALHAVPQISL